MMAAAMLAASVGGAAAQSLKEARAREAAERALNREAMYTREICASDLRTRIDWGSATDWPENVSLVSACDGALGALEAICRKPDARPRAQRIADFVCAADGAGASLSGSTLRYGATPGVSGYRHTRAVLDKRL